jgi:hypothetical protein
MVLIGLTPYAWPSLQVLLLGCEDINSRTLLLAFSFHSSRRTGSLRAFGLRFEPNIKEEYRFLILIRLYYEKGHATKYELLNSKRGIQMRDMLLESLWCHKYARTQHGLRLLHGDGGESTHRKPQFSPKNHLWC